MKWAATDKFKNDKKFILALAKKEQAEIKYYKQKEIGNVFLR